MKTRFVAIKKVHNDVWLRIYAQSRREEITIPELLLKSVLEHIERKKFERSNKTHTLNKEGLLDLAERLGIRRSGNDIEIINKIVEVVSGYRFPGEYEEEQEDQDYYSA